MDRWLANGEPDRTLLTARTRDSENVVACDSADVEAAMIILEGGDGSGHGLGHLGGGHGNI